MSEALTANVSTVKVFLSEGFSNGGGGEFSVDNSLGPYQAVRHLFYPGTLAFDDDDLHTEVVVQMDVQARNNGLPHLVLDVSQRIGQLPDVMVVDEGDRTDSFLIGLPFALNKVVPYKVPERLGPVSVPLDGNVFVEADQQAVGYRDPESCDLLAQRSGVTRASRC